ncbi:MAG: L-lactate dehydrogenase [Clostridia bacterium]|nr:L-lactate dehydrogenase [Clostridia bacterium]
MQIAKTKGKIVIIGSGFVGSTTAFAISMSGIASEIILVDANKEKAMGEALDINHGLSFISQMIITDGDYSDIKEADVIIITAGSGRKPGESRFDLAKKNADIFKDMAAKIMAHYTGGVILVVSNPVDVLTYLMQKLTGLPEGKVIGTGTVLDSSRFRYLLSEHCKIDVRNVHGYIIGEHGDSEVPVWSATNIAGKLLDQYCSVCKNRCGNVERERIAKDVKDSGAKIIKYKGATYYAIALSINRIVEAILKSQNSILTVSSVINGAYGISDVALSLPSVINSSGIEKIYDIVLREEELNALHDSAKKIKETIDKIM